MSWDCYPLHPVSESRLESIVPAFEAQVALTTARITKMLARMTGQHPGPPLA